MKGLCIIGDFVHICGAFVDFFFNLWFLVNLWKFVEEFLCVIVIVFWAILSVFVEVFSVFVEVFSVFVCHFHCFLLSF